MSDKEFKLIKGDLKMKQYVLRYVTTKFKPVWYFVYLPDEEAHRWRESWYQNYEQPATTVDDPSSDEAKEIYAAAEKEVKDEWLGDTVEEYTLNWARPRPCEEHYKTGMKFYYTDWENYEE